MDDIDERAEVDKKVEDGGVVIVEGKNGITIASEATEGLDAGVGAATEEWSVVVVITRVKMDA